MLVEKVWSTLFSFNLEKMSINFVSCETFLYRVGCWKIFLEGVERFFLKILTKLRSENENPLNINISKSEISDLSDYGSIFKYKS